MASDLLATATGSLASVGGVAAVDGQRGAEGEARGRAAQPQDGGGDLFRPAEAADATGVATAYQINARHDGNSAAGVAAPPLTEKWHRDLGRVVSYPVIANNRAFVTVRTGAQLSAMSDEEFEKEYPHIAVYARVQPEHKTRIVNAWRNAGYVTAMTGDGVNDAPSIKSADIGVGMGITGTDVTKNVADMVLADDNFATIVGAVEEGRRIYDNIRKAIQFLLSSNMSEVISIFAATLLGFTILEPVHLLWINLVTDCFPALALGMEEAEPAIMRRRPRDAKAGIFAGGMGVDVAYQGLVISALTIAAFFIGHFMESGVWEIPANGLSPDGTTMAFVTMSMAEIFHSLNMRSQRGSIFKLRSRNKMMTFAAIGSLLATTVVCEVPLLAAAFDFTSVELNEYLVALALAFCVVPIVELVKFFQRRGEAARS